MIDEEEAAEIGFVFEFLDVVAVGAADEAPIDETGVVAGGVLAIFREFNGEPVKWAAMKAVPESFHNDAGAEFHVPDGHQRLGMDVTGGRCSHALGGYFRGFGRIVGGFLEAADETVDGDALGFRFVVEENAVTEDGSGEGLDVLNGGVGAALQKRARFGAEDEVLASAKSSSPIDPVFDEVRGGGLARARGGGKADCVTDDFLRNGDFSDEAVEALNIVAREDGFDRFGAA